MPSPGHKANILRRQFREIGIGIAVGAPADAGGLTAPPTRRTSGSAARSKLPRTGWEARRLAAAAEALASAAAVADITPLHALHYDLERTGGLAPSPPRPMT